MQVVYDIYSKCFYDFVYNDFRLFKICSIIQKKEFIEIKNIFCWIFFFYKKINNLFVW